MIRKHQECCNPRPVLREETLLVFQTKMRKKTKYETANHEIQLDELESQVRVKGPFRIDFSLLIYIG